MRSIWLAMLAWLLCHVGVSAWAQSMHLQAVHLPIAQLFMRLADEAGVDVLIAADIELSTHVQWRQLSAHQGLQQLCELPSLHCHWVSSKSLVVSAAEAAPEPMMQTSVVPLQYASATQLASQLQASGAAFAGGSLVADERGSQLLLHMPRDATKKLQGLISALDKPLPQVQIEARILIASRDAGASLRRGLQVSMHQPGLAEVKQVTAASQVMPQAAGLAIGIVSPHIHLSMELAAMEASGQVMTLAQPQIVVQHLAQGRIETGQEIPYTSTDDQGESRHWKQAVLGLLVSPRVLVDDQVELDLSVVQDSVGELLANGELALNTHRLHTQVRLAFDQTIVLGGALYEQQLQSLMENPAWMALPFMQRWWQSKQQQVQSFELLVFVTPRLIARN